MQVTLTELKTNTGKYVALADSEDIFITKNGKKIAKITSAKMDKITSAKALFGIIPNDIDLDSSRMERLNEHSSIRY
ncbi:MAG: type II toxin-antitoxin system prevent-host-death family antitoxin [Elusimicrobiota bacterium]|jgi:prevent-host-death family protein|nr:type II toxin-antitoxin system prevent-host-death family antitoxin [Elusimicrobiota bacterium]